MTEAVEGSLESIVEFLKANPGYVTVVRKIIEVEESPSDIEVEKLGWKWYHVKVPAAKLNTLVYAGVIRISYDSRSSTNYRLVDMQTAKEALRRLSINGEQRTEEETQVDLFQDIIGYDDIKYWLRKIITSDTPGGAILIGPAASAKTMFLWDIAEKAGGQYYTGTGATRRGIQRYIADTKPKILIIDELDKLDSYDQSALLSVLESGLVAELKVGRTQRIQLKIKIFAAANDLRSISPLLISRFKPYVFNFRPYTLDEYVDIVKAIGSNRFNHDPEFCERVARAIYPVSKGDPRAAINALKLCGDGTELEKLLATVRKYSTG